MSSNKLKLIVFDLDYTLWPFWVDTHVDPPFKKASNNKIVDSHGKEIKSYHYVSEVLKGLHDDGYILAIASRTSEIKGANQLIDLFGWNKYLKYKQIFPGCKVTHFQNLQKETGLEFSEMLFFDDEARNIRDINKLGVVSILVKNGVGKTVVQDGIAEYQTKRN